MSAQTMPRDKKGGIWSEEEPIMQFFKDGDHLRIVAERLQGGSEEVYMTKEQATQVVRFIQHNSTAHKTFVTV